MRPLLLALAALAAAPAALASAPGLHVALECGAIEPGRELGFWAWLEGGEEADRTYDLYLDGRLVRAADQLNGVEGRTMSSITGPAEPGVHELRLDGARFDATARVEVREDARRLPAPSVLVEAPMDVAPGSRAAIGLWPFQETALAGRAFEVLRDGEPVANGTFPAAGPAEVGVALPGPGGHLLEVRGEGVYGASGVNVAQRPPAFCKDLPRDLPAGTDQVLVALDRAEARPGELVTATITARLANGVEAIPLVVGLEHEEPLEEALVLGPDRRAEVRFQAPEVFCDRVPARLQVRGLGYTHGQLTQVWGSGEVPVRSERACPPPVNTTTHPPMPSPSATPVRPEAGPGTPERAPEESRAVPGPAAALAAAALALMARARGRRRT